jgi:hypothetical protein
MGRSKIIRLILRKYRTKEFVCQWRKEYGRPTAENIGKFRDEFNQSLLKGGVNEHIGVNGWLQCGLEIYNQITNEVKAAYKSPMFEVLP